MANYSSSQKQKGVEINVFGFLSDISRKIWLIVAVGIIFGIAGGIVGRATVDYTYSSSISFIVNTLSGNEMAESSAVSAQINIANTFSYILDRRVMKEAVLEACSSKINYEDLDEAISVKTISDTNVIEMTVSTEDPELSYQIAKAVVDVYGDVVSKIYAHATLTVCDTPVKSSEPIANHSPLVVAACTAIGSMIICFAVMFIGYIIKDTVKSVSELGSRLDIPVLGSIQNVVNTNKNVHNLLITDKRTGFSFIETYKAIRTKIENDSAKNDHKVYIITSACENEGKTTVSVNIALSLAQNGKTVLLVDADLRNPSVTKMLSLPDNPVGFSDVITGDGAIRDAIKLIKTFNLFVLGNYKSVTNPTELLSMKTAGETITQLRSEFDYIIIDTAPASIVTDASIIAEFSDAAIMVVREDVAPFSRIQMSMDDLDSNGTQIIGSIFNGDTHASRANKGRYGKRYGYGGYGYGYGGYGGYGYGYGSSHHNNKNK